MDAALINPFITATQNVLSTMASIKATAGKVALKSNNLTWGDITGIIGMAGDNIKGNLIISFERAVILKAVSAMLGEEFKEVNQEVMDAVGEVTNMICGGTKASLSELGFKIDMASPIVVAGQGVQISQLTQHPVLVIPFSTPEGSFVVEASLYKE